MKIVMSFIGGSLDGKVVAGDPDDQSSAAKEATMLFLRSRNGTVGYQYMVDAVAGIDIYEVTDTIDRGASLIVRSRFVAHRMNHGDLNALLACSYSPC